MDIRRIFKSPLFLSNRLPDKPIGDYLKSKRVELDLSIRGLGRQVNIDSTYISSLERNKHGYIPSNKVLRKLSGALNIDFTLLARLRRPLIEDRMRKYEEEEEEKDGV